MRVRISFNPAVDADAVTLAQLFPLARHLRGVIADCRPATAQDFMPAAGGTAASYAVDKANPYGYDLADLRARVQAAFAESQSWLTVSMDQGRRSCRSTLLTRSRRRRRR